MTRSSPFVETVDERREVLERVRLVGVAHDDVLPACRGQPRDVCAPVASPALRDDTSAVCGGDLGRAVRGAVVHDDHLAASLRAPDPLERLVDDFSDRLFLVQAGDDDGDLGLGRHAYAAPATVARRG